MYVVGKSCLNQVRYEFFSVVKAVDAELRADLGTAPAFARAVVDSECRRISALGEARGTGIHHQHALEVLLKLKNVRVAEKVGVDVAVLFAV